MLRQAGLMPAVPMNNGYRNSNYHRMNGISNGRAMDNKLVNITTDSTLPNRNGYGRGGRGYKSNYRPVFRGGNVDMDGGEESNVRRSAEGFNSQKTNISLKLKTQQ